MKFYDREKEMKFLKNLKGRFRIVVTGRRRIGKTRLVEEFLKNKGITLFIPSEKSEKEVIFDWSSEYKEIPRVNTFKDLFEYLFSHEKKTIFIDELQNVLKVNKGFLFDLQRLIDKYNPRLIVSGSLIRTMKRLIEDYRSPLFGRFDAIIRLKEFDFLTVAKICGDLGLDFKTTVKLFSVFGGIPKYYEFIEKLKKFVLEDFLADMFVYYPRPLYDEVKITLKEEFGKEHRMFFSILSAISQGNTKLSEISNFVGKEQTKLTKYLHLLINDFEIVKREVPLVGSSKRGVYRIDSNLIDFWFRNVWRYSELLEKDEEEKVAGFLKKDLDRWVGQKFESIILSLLRAGVFRMFEFTKIGKQWGKIKGKPKGKNTYEIDILALNEKKKEILVCECKWKDKVNALRNVKDLAEKLEYVKWNKEKRKETLAIFAKSFSKKVDQFDGKKVHCFDLKDLARICGFRRKFKK